MRNDTKRLALHAAGTIVPLISAAVYFKAGNAWAFLFMLLLVVVNGALVVDAIDERDQRIARERRAAMRRHPAGGRYSL